MQKVQINTRTTAKDLVKILEETGAKVSISTVKQVLYRNNLKGRSARKNPQLQNHYKKSDYGLQLHTGTNIVLFGDMSSGLNINGHNGHKDHCCIWRKKGEACNPKNTIPTRGRWQHHVEMVLCCRRDWCTSQNIWHHEERKLWMYWSHISRHQSGS